MRVVILRNRRCVTSWFPLTSRAKCALAGDDSYGAVSERYTANKR